MTTTLTMANRIADAACFIDSELKFSLPIARRAAANEHAQHLHDAAQVLAGDRAAKAYPPDDCNFEQGKHYTSNVLAGHTVFDLTHWRDSDGQVIINFAAQAHPMRMSIYPTVTELRALAIGLKQLADDAEASAEQVHQEQLEEVVA